MNMNAPLQESLSPLSPGWSNWFSQATNAVQGWTKSYTAQSTLDFPSIPANSQQRLNTSAAPLKVGDIVHVTPLIDIAGVIFTGIVATDGVLTIIASNITTGAINPPSTSFRVVILQN